MNPDDLLLLFRLVLLEGMTLFWPCKVKPLPYILGVLFSYEFLAFHRIVLICHEYKHDPNFSSNGLGIP